MAVKARVLTRFPARVVGGSGISVTKANGVYTIANIASGFSALSPMAINSGVISISGTKAQFNAALTDGDFATLAGTESLTNKTLVTPTISTSATFAGSTTPSALFSPSSGATTIGVVYQQSNLLKVGSSGIEDKLRFDLTSRGAIAALVPVAITTQNNSSESGLSITQTGSQSGSVAGTVSNASAGNPALAYNQIFITAEGANVTGATDPKFTYGNNVAMVTGGANSTGGKIASNVFIYKSAASTPATVRDHIALNASGLIDAGDGGTGTTVSTGKGTMFGAGIGAHARSGATNLFAVAGVEFDVGMDAGSSAHMRLGVSTVSTGTVGGTEFDAAYEVGASVNGWTHGVLFDDFHGGPPIKPTGTVLGTNNTARTVANFANFASWTFTGNIFNFPNFSLTGGGAMSVGSIATSGNVNVGGGLGVGVAYSTHGAGVNEISGSNSGQFVFAVQNSHGAAGDLGMLVAAGSSGNGADTTTLVRFYNSGLTTILGEITRNGAGAVAYATSSDARGKPNKEPLASSHARDTINALRVWDFDKDGNDIRGIGVVAQEAYEVHPSFACQPTEPDGYWMHEKAAPVPFLIRNVQENNREIDELKEELRKLKQQLSRS